VNGRELDVNGCGKRRPGGKKGDWVEGSGGCGFVAIGSPNTLNEGRRNTNMALSGALGSVGALRASDPRFGSWQEV